MTTALRFPCAQRMLLLLALILAPAFAAALPPGISGSWYNPAQPGHGLSLQLLDDGSALLFWYVFDPAGNPVHLYIEGDVDGTTIEGRGYLGEGMRFGSFDPAQHSLGYWGTVEIAFADCDSATLSWDADGEAGTGYGAGSMPLRRLTGIASLPCALPSPASLRLPQGRYIGNWGRSEHAFDPELWAAVDADGVLWATAQWPQDGVFSTPFPAPPVFVGRPASAAEFLVTVDLEVRAGEALATRSVLDGFVQPVEFVVVPAGAAHADLEKTPEPRLVEEAHFNRYAHDDDPLRRAFDPADLVGSSYAFAVHQHFVRPEFRVRFLADGAICIDALAGMECALSGQVGAADPGLAMFDITLVDQRASTTGQRMQGKGWIDRGTLVLVATGEETALGVVAQPE